MHTIEKSKMPRLASIVILLASLHVTELFAASASEKNEPKHWLAQVGEEMRATSPKEGINMQGKIKFVHGNDIWQPGQQFKDGDDWLGLACDQQGCKLEPAALKVKKESWQGHYDDKPTAGQRLRFGLREKSKGKVIAWFNTRTSEKAAASWLKPSGVPAYYSGIGHPRPTGKGTLESLVEMPDGDTASLVPLLLSAKWSPDLLRQFNPDDNSSTFLLQLRAQGKRQILPGQLGTCSHGVDSQRYLLWSGDLDGDGKPDFLISFVDAEGPVHLYLSGAARPNQIVGLAGVHSAPPFGGECDGGEADL